MIQRKAFLKWLFITALCGGHSFFWGVSAQGSLLAMILGILTLALMFAVIESHGKYQARRATAPRLARALDGGVKFRCFLAVYVVLSILLNLDSKLGNGWLGTLLMAPFMGELYVGMGALSLSGMITGINMADWGKHGVATTADHFIATYLTTIFTGLAHTIILALLCLVAFGVVRLRGKDKSAAIEVNDGAPKV